MDESESLNRNSEVLHSLLADKCFVVYSFSNLSFRYDFFQLVSKSRSRGAFGNYYTRPHFSTPDCPPTNIMGSNLHDVPNYEFLYRAFYSIITCEVLSPTYLYLTLGYYF